MADFVAGYHMIVLLEASSALAAYGHTHLPGNEDAPAYESSSHVVFHFLRQGDLAVQGTKLEFGSLLAPIEPHTVDIDLVYTYFYHDV